ncbi:hypothetical protein CEXT_314321 [Caerostris extrusa]|uniref:Secreted protein n=1 Tax=Caerostris extrusa TaxID=172846 RepID=A0AAV4XEM2_CAEEX|nr:hypothetical protein CEXT_314321 [Caerostris extrusa]
MELIENWMILFWVGMSSGGCRLPEMGNRHIKKNERVSYILGERESEFVHCNPLVSAPKNMHNQAATSTPRCRFWYVEPHVEQKKALKYPFRALFPFACADKPDKIKTNLQIPRIRFVRGRVYTERATCAGP